MKLRYFRHGTIAALILVVILFVRAQNIQIPQVISERAVAAHFPKNFLFGATCAAFQDWGSQTLPHSNWAHFEKGVHADGNPHIARGEQSGDGNGNFSRHLEDIELLTKLGLNSYRFSIDWSFIEPVEGEFKQEAIDHYVNYCKKLGEAGIKPMVTLHHFVHPQWFEEKGAFEKTENIAHFLTFAVHVFKQLSPHVELWCTFNEPTIYSFQSYVMGEFPPAKTDLHLAGIVTKNILKAHVMTYRTLKQLPGGDKAQIGLVHQYLKFEPYSFWNPVEKIPAHFLNIMTHYCVFNFLKTGSFSYKIPFKASVNEQNMVDLSQEKIIDFIGINYYSNPLITLFMTTNTQTMVQSSCYAGEYMTDMQYRAYPQGLYEMIEESAVLKVPMYITENGIADDKDDRREYFIQSYLYAVSKALKKGYNVRGYYYWSLMDNFEWAEGWGPKFGLYEVNLATKKRTLRKGSEAYQRIIALSKEGSAESIRQQIASPTHEITA